MKRLLLLRHAQTHDAARGQADIDRTLTRRGVQDAQAMADLLRRKGIIPNILLCSTATRTQQTAAIFGEILNVPTDNIHKHEAFYHASSTIFLDALYALEDTVDTALIVAHNPSISLFASEISNATLAIDMRPASMVGLTFSTDKWTSIDQASRTLFLIENPTSING
ncbi:MAG: histidine phosphatase family protein [Bacteroidetes bacterium]|nr:histidine phosphatase family protein [Bacteroidota bacterium]